MRLNEQSIRKIEPPASGNRVVWDDELIGFGLRTTANGAKAFVLRYVIDGRERRRPFLHRNDAAQRQNARRRADELSERWLLALANRSEPNS